MLVRRHGPMVFQTARRVLGNTQDAEDVLQATFLRLAQRVGTLQRPGGLAGWLHEVATNMALTLRRDKARRAEREKRLQMIAPRSPAEPEPPSEELSSALDAALAALPSKYRLPVVLCDL